MTESSMTILRRMLDERGVEYTQALAAEGTLFIVVTNKEHYFILVRDNDAGIEMWSRDLTPEQAIAATLGPAVRHPKPHEKWTTVLLPEIAWGLDDGWPDYLSVAHDAHGEWRTYVPEATLGNRTDLSKRLREVYGLHAFAELFGFDWTDGSDWDWHDVACAMADAVDAATVRTGACREIEDEDTGFIVCSECGAVHDESYTAYYCWCCGRRIEQ